MITAICFTAIGLSLIVWAGYCYPKVTDGVYAGIALVMSIGLMCFGLGALGIYTILNQGN